MPPKRTEITIGDVQFRPDQVRYWMTRDATHHGTRVGESMQVRATVYMDASDTSRLPGDKLASLWDFAKGEKFDPKKVSIKYYKDDEAGGVVAEVQFKGWISHFETYNPSGRAGDSQGASSGIGSAVGTGQTLVIGLVGVLDDSNYGDHRFTA